MRSRARSRAREKQSSDSTPIEDLQIEAPPSKVAPAIVVSEDDDTTQVVPCAEAAALTFMRTKLQRELAALGIDDDSDEPVPIAVSPARPKRANDRTIIFELPDDTEIETVLREGQSFAQLIEELPIEYRLSSMSVDGIPLSSLDIAGDLMVDYSRVTVEKRVKPDSMKKLSFALPNGEKKKLRVDSSTTFQEVLKKLGCPQAQLSFDGYQIDVVQRIQDNHDIEDGDQIDVKL
jgi:hypothetical protein